jgi:hypothetical protein
MRAAELVQQRKQAERRELVSRNHKFSLVQLSKFKQRIVRFNAQVQQLFGVFDQHTSGIRKTAVAGRAIEESLAQFFFKFSDRLTDCGLRSVKFLSSAREAFFVRNGDERFQLV